MYGHGIVFIMWGRWKCLDVVLQAGGNFKIWRGWWSGVEPVALSRHSIAIGDPCVIGVKIKIYRFDITIMYGKAGGVWKTEHCASISLMFLVCGAAVHGGGFVRAWNGMAIFQNWPLAWRHFKYCSSVIITTCVSSYVIPIYLSLILYLADMSPCDTVRLKNSYIWSCCALSWIGISVSRRNCSFATSTWVLRYL